MRPLSLAAGAACVVLGFCLLATLGPVGKPAPRPPAGASIFSADDVRAALLVGLVAGALAALALTSRTPKD